MPVLIEKILLNTRIRILHYRSRLRVFYYRQLGMKIGSNSKLEKINVEWPNKIRIGKNCKILRNTTFWIQSPFSDNNNILIGNNVFIGINTEFNCCDYIKIGNNCLIASSTVFVDSSHGFEATRNINEQSTKLKGIDVEEDVWVGTNCKILIGVRLGRGCIVGAGAVVNKSIPPFEIWAGVPARKIGIRS